MNAAAAPVLIGYDGSGAAGRAIRETAELFGSRRALLVVTVWEPGVEYKAPAIPAAEMGMSPPLVNVAATQEADDALQARANRVAQRGAELAKSVGLRAESLAVPGEGSVANAIVELARTRRVAAIVVGSRGSTGLRARLEGSTAIAVLKHSACPVVVVHDD